VIRSYRESGVVSRIFAGLLIFAVPVVIFTIPIWLDWLPWAISPFTVGIVGLCFMLALMFSGVAIAYAMATTGFIGVHYLSSWTSALTVSGIAPYMSTASYFMMAIPLFILMGSLCATARGISTNLFNTVDKWMGRLPGGLAMATVGGCAAFGAVCGDTLATVATMGKVALPEMKRCGYDDALMTGCVAAGGTLGIMIPPSLVFIFYAIVVEESIGALFIAGIFPGILIAAMMMVAIYIQARRNPALAAARYRRTTFMEKLISLKGTAEMLILFLLVIGGIYTGLFTPVEAGAIGAAGALLIALVRRFITRQEFADALLGAAEICGMLLLILAGVGFLGTFLALSHLPVMMGDYVSGLDISRWVIFSGIVLMYVVLGCVMNIIPAILLSLPVIMPTVLALGFDPVWFGVIMVLMVMMGQITPPVGIACFVVRSIAPEVPLSTIFRGILPHFAAMLVCVVILAAFPQIALFLPSLMR
jgi:tripartite ATP-independent transporter DctM subunit